MGEGEFKWDWGEWNGSMMEVWRGYLGLIDFPTRVTLCGHEVVISVEKGEA